MASQNFFKFQRKNIDSNEQEKCEVELYNGKITNKSMIIVEGQVECSFSDLSQQNQYELKKLLDIHKSEITEYKAKVKADKARAKEQEKALKSSIKAIKKIKKLF